MEAGIAGRRGCRTTLEGGVGGKNWRKATEGDLGRRTWRETLLEEGIGVRHRRNWGEQFEMHGMAWTNPGRIRSMESWMHTSAYWGHSKESENCFCQNSHYFY